MARIRRTQQTTACPFIDLDDSRCAPHFTLGRMQEAFDLCLCQHQCCSTYYRIQAEQQAHIRLTLFGQPIESDTTPDMPPRIAAEDTPPISPDHHRAINPPATTDRADRLRNTGS